MYRNRREYQCDICGKRTNGEYDRIWNCFSLPGGWTGSARKYGECFCNKCSKAIKNLKENQS